MRWLLLALCLALIGCDQRARTLPKWLSSLTRKSPPSIQVPRDSFPISRADLSWGRVQVDRMMRDRPGMAQLVHKGDVIYEFAARQFGGASNHYRILWDATPPGGKYFADNSRAEGVSTIRIQIRTYWGHPLNAQELWACAIFELLNSSHQDEWHRQFVQATKGLYLRDEFIWAVASLEFLTAGRVKQFYLTCWQPFLQAKGLKAEPEFWYVDLPSTLAEWKDSYDRIGYPYDAYGPHYDLALRYRHWKESAEDEYARAVQEMEKRLNSKARQAQLAEITRQAEERSFHESWRAIARERARNPYQDRALQRWNASLAEPEPQPEQAAEPPAPRRNPARPRVVARPGDHAGETAYSNIDDSGLRAHR